MERDFFLSAPATGTRRSGSASLPDGKQILFASEVYPECDTDACNKAKDDERAGSKVKAMVFTRLFYRHWNHYTNNKRSHLFVVSTDGGTARDITPGDHDAPTFFVGGSGLYAISPDGSEVAFTSNHDEVEAISTNNDIFVVSATGGTPKKISTSPGSDSTPLYSPDGKWIAWRMQERAGYESDRFRLVIYDRKTGQIRNLTENFDHWVESIAWSPDSKTIYFTSEDQGELPIYSIEIEKPDPREIARGANDELQVSSDGQTLVVTRMSAKAPNEIYKADLGLFKSLSSIVAGHVEKDGTITNRSRPRASLTEVQLTHLNDAVLSQVAMQPLESFWFSGAGGTNVQGFIVKPPNFDPHKKYPVKFLIHGGPQGQWGDEWSYRWNSELFAANGYVIVQINPRGSTGYGQKFTLC